MARKKPRVFPGSDLQSFFWEAGDYWNLQRARFDLASLVVKHVMTMVQNSSQIVVGCKLLQCTKLGGDIHSELGGGRHNSVLLENRNEVKTSVKRLHPFVNVSGTSDINIFKVELFESGGKHLRGAVFLRVSLYNRQAPRQRHRSQ